jgi:hypothetical protein
MLCGEHQREYGRPENSAYMLISFRFFVNGCLPPRHSATGKEKGTSSAYFALFLAC